MLFSIKHTFGRFEHIKGIKGPFWRWWKPCLQRTTLPWVFLCYFLI